jgi:hypothetical protein
MDDVLDETVIVPGDTQRILTHVDRDKTSVDLQQHI